MALFCSESGDSKLPALVLIHAYPLSHKFWEAQVKGLASEAHVLAIDLPGFGLSPPLNEANPTMGHFAQAIIEFLQQRGIEKATFAGCSMGGYILFEIWRRYPQKVQGLIFCNTKAESDNEDGRAGRYKTAARLKAEGNTHFMAEDMIPRVFSAKIQASKADKVEKVKALIRESPVQGAIDGSLAMAVRADSIPTLPTISVPSLIICGTEDPITGESVMKPMRDGIKGVTFVLIPDAGHLSPMDSPEQVTHAISEFLKAHKFQRSTL